MLKIFLIIVSLFGIIFNNYIIANSEKTNLLLPNCTFGVRPEWVCAISTPIESAKHNHKNILEYILFDIQVDIRSATKFSRIIKRLLTNRAVQNYAMIEIEFEPSYESIILHSLCVHRKDQKIEKIHTSRKEIIQQEREIDNYTFNGRKTWVIFLDDIKPGDVIEYSYSKKGLNPIFKGLFSDVFYLQTSFPIERAHFRIIGSEDRHLYFKSHNTHESFLPVQENEWSLEISDVDAYQYDSLEPSWHIGMPFIQVSEFSNWHEVAVWGNELFKLPDNYSPEIKQLVAEWKENSSDPEKQVLQALRFVQNEIRYLGFELGDNTHMPNNPNQVLQQGYGDCKDKTLLLKAFLTLLDVESTPVFVSSSMKTHIKDWHPTPMVFDHAILQIRLNNRFLWVDPTRSHQGGDLWNSYCTHFGKGLVLHQSTSNLKWMPKSANSSQIVSSTTFNISEFEDAVTITDEIVYKGMEADNRRVYCDQNGIRNLGKSYTDYYSKKYGEIEILAPMACQDDVETNELVLKSSYRVQNPWKFGDNKEIKLLEFSAAAINEALNFDILPIRTAPLNLGPNQHIIENIFLVKEEGQWSQVEDQNKLISDEISFSYKAKNQNNVLHLSYELKTKEDHVPVSNLAQHRKHLQDIEKVIFQQIQRPVRGSTGNWLDVLESAPQSIQSYIILLLITIFYVWLFAMIVRRKQN